MNENLRKTNKERTGTMKQSVKDYVIEKVNELINAPT